MVDVREGLLEILSGNSGHGNTLLTCYPGTRVLDMRNMAGFGSDPDAVTDSTCRVKPAGYPGSKQRVTPLLIITIPPVHMIYFPLIITT